MKMPGVSDGSDLAGMPAMVSGSGAMNGVISGSSTSMKARQAGIRPGSRKWLPLLLFVAGIAADMGRLVTGQQLKTERTPRYHLQPGDVIRVKYRLSPEFDATVTLQPDGFVSLPSLGETHIAELTLPEALNAIQQQAATRLNNPEVSVELMQFENPYLTVTGLVAHPGKVDIHEPLTAMQAIGLAGGFSDGANRSQVLLIRPIDAHYGSTRLIDLNRLLKPGSRNEEIAVQSRDMLVVSADRFTKVSRVVKLVNPGIYVPLR